MPSSPGGAQAVVRGEHLGVDLLDGPVGTEHGDAVAAHVPLEILVEDGERPLHLVLLVELGRLAAPLPASRGHVGEDVEARSSGRGAARSG